MVKGTSSRTSSGVAAGPTVRTGRADPDGPAPRNNSTSLRRALAALSYVADHADQPDGIPLGALAEGVGLNKSTLLRLLAPLVEEGLLTRDSRTGGYQLGPRTAYLGGVYLERLDVREVAREILADLVRETGETAHLVILDRLEVAYVDKVESANTIRMHSRIGARQPLYSTSVGKALLAHLPEQTFNDVVAAGLVAKTPYTITDEGSLRAQLDQIRQRGYAIDDMENELGIRCVGAAVFDSFANPVAALSVSGPELLLTLARAAEVGPIVMAAANQVSARLGSKVTVPTQHTAKTAGRRAG